MLNSKSDSYAAAGVDITAGYRAVELMKKHIARTVIPGAEGGIGDFGGLFVPDLTGMKRPVLVSGTDGVGTKIKLAFLMDKHDTVGIDCVAMCVNDVICCGAKPLLFLDYIACGKNVPERIAEIVGGVAEGCVQAGCALVGGETAEHPGLMPEDEYDLAGFTVGLVDADKMVDKSAMGEGDVVLGLRASGVHSNGFSLVRRVFDVERRDLTARVVKGISHITGGGFYENIPRSIPSGLTARIERAAVPVLPIFDLIAREGNIPERDMFNTFNMGVGMSLVVSKDEADRAVEALRAAGEDPVLLGEIVKGEKRVVIC